ncbi:hypothetical protein E1B28_011203 [Marasmius oreades]|uniref:Mediator of RNA polymerase II transcription subunit 19 n=1 Tax=Marasmius oreades TaxID=181124 RepID=A0A9P7RU83_9AGAR|nr:uncharacterized protein E1B28_011203 [Marasmius oreades]KAG7089528.1 hypothetical protein E1B28_011203 [Marasmius oreades]
MQTNAVAGPSSLYLQPVTQPPQPQYIKSTNDLLAQFCLNDAYDKYVKPPPPTDPTSPSTADKGKGKETAATPAGEAQDQDDDDVTGKGEKKKKNSYRHLIKGVPGKHSMKKDDYLMTTMQVPPKQRVTIAPFDLKTQTEAFDVSLEGLKGWNQATLILESAQAREDRKKRKELKKLAKAQMQGQATMQSQTVQPQPGTSTPKPFTPSSITAASASTPSSHPPRTSTPQPQLQKSVSSTTQRPNPHVHPQQILTTTPTSSTIPAPIIPRPNSTPSAAVSGNIVHPPNPRNHVPSPVQVPTQKVGTPMRSATPTAASAGHHPLSAPPLSANTAAFGTVSSALGQAPRGKKRELEESSYGPPSQQHESMNGHANGIPSTQSASKSIIGVRAGNNGVRPRPIKKQRMDAQGLGRETSPVQQPTPQGV